ncbi:hypothetical protein DFH06DRAFT_1316422 [Mycena polygramma]|nr:hypothetical protein DFH06DRAFT_1316422 [Mycena polygramma]
MTHHGFVPPAAGTPAAGANASTTQQALEALSGAVDLLSASASSLAITSMLDMGDAIAGVVAAADAVRRAHDDITAAMLISLTPAAPAPAAAAPVTAPAPTSTFIRTTGPWKAGFLYSVIPTAPLTGVPDNGGKWHAITRGKYIGLTQNAAVSLNAVTGISTGLSQKLGNQVDALNHFNAALATDSLAVQPSTPQSPQSAEYFMCSRSRLRLA